MKPQQGATYLHHKGGLYMVIGSAIEESSGREMTIYADFETSRTWIRPTEDFVGSTPSGRRRFELKIPPEPSIGLPAVAYLWTDRATGHRMATLPDEAKNLDSQPGVQREALVRLTDAFAKWQMERLVNIAHRLKEGT